MKNDQKECFAWKSLYSMNKERKTGKEIDRHGDRERERQTDKEKEAEREYHFEKKKRSSL